MADLHTEDEAKMKWCPMSMSSTGVYARAGHKGDRLEDLRKAAWYLNREIEKLQRAVVRAAEDTDWTLDQEQAERLGG
jgi:hypothetical protein